MFAFKQVDHRFHQNHLVWLAPTSYLGTAAHMVQTQVRVRWLGRGAVGIEDILIRGNGLHEGYVFGVRLGLGLGLGLGMKPGRGGRVGGRGPGFMPCLSLSQGCGIPPTLDHTMLCQLQLLHRCSWLFDADHDCASPATLRNGQLHSFPFCEKGIWCGQDRMFQPFFFGLPQIY